MSFLGKFSTEGIILEATETIELLLQKYSQEVLSLLEKVLNLV